MRFTPRRLRFLLAFYPPYLGAGIRVSHIADDWSELRVSMRLRFFNKNAVGTHFGGSLYSMVDPHLMLLAMNRLGPDYVVWDQSATIDFVRPGRGRVEAVLRLEDADVEAMRRETEDGSAYRPEFGVEIRDGSGQLVARVRKVLYVRRRA